MKIGLAGVAAWITNRGHVGIILRVENEDGVVLDGGNDRSAVVVNRSESVVGRKLQRGRDDLAGSRVEYRSLIDAVIENEIVESVRVEIRYTERRVPERAVIRCPEQRAVNSVEQICEPGKLADQP